MAWSRVDHEIPGEKRPARERAGGLQKDPATLRPSVESARDELL